MTIRHIDLTPNLGNIIRDGNDCIYICILTLKHYNSALNVSSFTLLYFTGGFSSTGENEEDAYSGIN